jgi:site-specific DNA recombinase
VAAKLAEQAAGRRTNPMKTVSSPLTRIIFDATGEAMSPSFSYGRGGRPYRYYIARNLQVGGAAPADDDVIRRVSASGLEAVLLKLLVRLSDGRVTETEDLRRCVRRVELRRMDTHLVVRMSELLPGENPRLWLAQILDRLKAGEQAVWEDGSRPDVRRVLSR